MGTSGSFSGSGGRDAQDLRDSIADWLDEPDSDATSDTPSLGSSDLPPDRADLPDQPDAHQPIDIAPALRLLLRSRGGSDGPGGSGSGWTGAADGGGRSSGGADRSVGRISRATGRAGGLALAYNAGNRETLERAGLDYDELRALDTVTVGLRIVEAAFDTQPDSTIDDSEAREIVAAVVEWILAAPPDHQPSPEDVARKAIESIIADVILTEVAAKIHERGSSYERRQATEKMIRDLAEEHANQVPLSPAGATERELADAIEGGIRDLGTIMGVDG